MILCAGESLIDMVQDLQNLDRLAFRPLAGGSVYNTAVALGRLGVPTGYLWPMSRDALAEAVLLPPLAKANVDISLCPRTERQTTLAFVELNERQATYRFYDEGSAGRMFSIDELPALPKTVSALFIGGISLVPDPCGATIEELVARARARGIPVMMDPNIRPFFITDETAYRARLSRLLAQVDMVKLSLDEITWLTGQNGSVQQLIAEILAMGPKVVFHTDGERGAEAHWQGGAVARPAKPVTVEDTIGAGDTFNAGILAQLSRMDALKDGLSGLDEKMLGEALSLAVAAAAVTVSRHGANPPWAHEVAAHPG